MRTSNETLLERQFKVFDKFDWGNPSVSLPRLCSELVGCSDNLRATVADHVESMQKTPRNPGGFISYDLITRVDYPLHRAPSGDYECTLINGLDAIKPSSAIKPHINAKGYWLATILLRGSVTVQYFNYDGIGDSTWFRHEYLRRGDSETLTELGQSYILAPDRIHRLTEVSEGAITLTFRVMRGAQPYRNYIRMMDHIAVTTREPWANRQAMLVARLRGK